MDGTLDRLAARFETWIGLDRDHPVVGQITGPRPFHDFEDFDMALTELLR